MMFGSVGPVDLTAGTVGNSDQTIPTGQFLIPLACNAAGSYATEMQ